MFTVRQTHQFIANAMDLDDLYNRVWHVAQHLGIVVGRDFLDDARECRIKNMIEMACYLETAQRRKERF